MAGDPLLGPGPPTPIVQQAQATFLELFFDLVLVFALTRIVSRIFDHLVIDPHDSAWRPAVAQAAKTLLLLLALFGLWQGRHGPPAATLSTPSRCRQS
ncbi:low temperature requirement protein A [Micromonospora sp. NBC_00617]|uniref:low temperature requirement protein A n=1 Tax=Micromonospora sp. NBC_00617 TaxID=2903587 RepID=UPI0030E2EDEB